MSTVERIWRDKAGRDVFVLQDDNPDSQSTEFVDMAWNALTDLARDDVADRFYALMGGKKVTNRFVGDISSPEWAEGKFISGDRLIKIVRQKKDGKPKAWLLNYYLFHEIGHGVDVWSGGSGEESETLPLFDPRPNGWGDTSGGDSYWHDPSECFAHEWAFASVKDIDSISDTYNDDYTRKIANDELGQLRNIWLSDEAPAEPPDTGEPPDPCTATAVYSEGSQGQGYYETKLRARIDEALAKLSERVATGKATIQTYVAIEAVLRPHAIDEDE